MPQQSTPYTLESGDTLFNVAQRSGNHPKALRDANPTALFEPLERIAVPLIDGPTGGLSSFVQRMVDTELNRRQAPYLPADSTNSWEKDWDLEEGITSDTTPEERLAIMQQNFRGREEFRNQRNPNNFTRMLINSIPKEILTQATGPANVLNIKMNKFPLVKKIRYGYSFLKC